MDDTCADASMSQSLLALRLQSLAVHMHTCLTLSKALIELRMTIFWCAKFVYLIGKGNEYMEAITLNQTNA